MSLYCTKKFIKPITAKQVKEQFYNKIPKDHIVIFRIDSQGNVMLSRLMHKANYDDINSKYRGAYKSYQLFDVPYNYLKY